jgi:hypothetical protein
VQLGQRLGTRQAHLGDERPGLHVAAPLEHEQLSAVTELHAFGQPFEYPFDMRFSS